MTYAFIMPVYNSSKTIGLAIESMLSQTLKPKEIIIVDDGSTDETVRIVEEFRCDKIVCLRNEVNHGVAFSLNRAIRQTKAEIILRMDGDDYSLPDRAMRQVEIIRQNPDCVVGGDCYMVKSMNKGWRVYYPISPGEASRWLKNKRSPLCHPAVGYRKKVIMSVGGYKDNAFPAEDIECWLRMNRAGISLINSGEIEVVYRVHKESVSRKRGNEQGRVVNSLYESRGQYDGEVVNNVVLEKNAVIECGMSGPSVKRLRMRARRLFDKAMLETIEDNSIRSRVIRVAIKSLIIGEALLYTRRNRKMRKRLLCSEKTSTSQQ